MGGLNMVKVLEYRDIAKNKYSITDEGVVTNLKTGKIVNYNDPKNNSGYCRITLRTKTKKSKKYQLHRLVLATFTYDCELEVNHKDGNKLNNNVENLEFCTYKYNLIHALSHGLLKSRAKKIRCLNTGVIFCSICDAAQWCNCSDSSIRDYLFYNKNRESAGKHPLTGEKLQWELVL